MRNDLYHFCLVVLSLVTPCSASAHEYWLAPLEYSVGKSEPISADIRNGENFGGRAYTCIPDKIKSIRLVGPQGSQSINCKEGAFPAIKTGGSHNPGYYLLMIETTQRRVSYGSWDRFGNFLKSHGQFEKLNQYESDVKPEGRIQEQFYRFSKTLVIVNGEIQGQWGAFDKPSMEFDIVPLSNPLSAEPSLELKVFYNDQALAKQQLDVFKKESNEVERTVYLTDERGIARINVSRNAEYLVNSVLLLEADSPEVDWKTLWSSFTFKR